MILLHIPSYDLFFGGKGLYPTEIKANGRQRENYMDEIVRAVRYGNTTKYLLQLTRDRQFMVANVCKLRHFGKVKYSTLTFQKLNHYLIQSFAGVLGSKQTNHYFRHLLQSLRYPD